MIILKFIKIIMISQPYIIQCSFMFFVDVKDYSLIFYVNFGREKVNIMYIESNCKQ